jgi:hypothetical protein
VPGAVKVKDEGYGEIKADVGLAVHQLVVLEPVVMYGV